MADFGYTEFQVDKLAYIMGKCHRGGGNRWYGIESPLTNPGYLRYQELVDTQGYDTVNKYTSLEERYRQLN